MILDSVAISKSVLQIRKRTGAVNADPFLKRGEKSMKNITSVSKAAHFL